MQELRWSTARQMVRLSNGDIPHHKQHAQFMNGGWSGGQESICSSHFREFKSSLVQEFELFQNFMKFVILGFCNHCLGTVNQSSGGEKNGIVYSLVCIFVIIIIISISSSITSISIWCLIELSLSLPMSFPFCPFLLCISLQGKERGEQAAVWCLVGGFWVKL